MLELVFDGLHEGNLKEPPTDIKRLTTLGLAWQTRVDRTSTKHPTRRLWQGAEGTPSMNPVKLTTKR